MMSQEEDDDDDQVMMSQPHISHSMLTHPVNKSQLMMSQEEEDDDDDQSIISQPVKSQIRMSQPYLLTQSMNLNDDEDDDEEINRKTDFSKIVNTNKISFVPENNELIYNNNYLSLNNIDDSEKNNNNNINFHLDHEKVNIKPFFDNNVKLMNIGNNNVDYLVNKNININKNKKQLQGVDNINLENNDQYNFDLINGTNNLLTNSCSNIHKRNYNCGNIPKINQDLTGYSNDFVSNATV
jgi:hypothetical protein